MIEILNITFRTLSHGNSMVYFLIMGDAGFISSTVPRPRPALKAQKVYPVKGGGFHICKTYFCWVDI